MEYTEEEGGRRQATSVMVISHEVHIRGYASQAVNILCGLGHGGGTQQVIRRGA